MQNGKVSSSYFICNSDSITNSSLLQISPNNEFETSFPSQHFSCMLHTSYCVIVWWRREAGSPRLLERRSVNEKMLDTCHPLRTMEYLEGEQKRKHDETNQQMVKKKKNVLLPSIIRMLPVTTSVFSPGGELLDNHEIPRKGTGWN